MTNTKARPCKPDIWADYQSLAVRLAYAWMKAKRRPQGPKAGDSFAFATMRKPHHDYANVL